jgi:AraC-like DNA-binding protein
MHDTLHSLHKTPRMPLQIIFAGPYSAPVGKHFPPHQHTSWEVVYYRSGRIPCPVGNEHFESQPGMLLLTPPYMIHAEYAVEAYSNFFIAINAPARHPWPRMLLDDERHTFGNLCAAIVDEWTGQGYDREEMLSLLVNQLDILLLRTRTQPWHSEAERIVREAERLMTEHFTDSLTIRNIAKELGVSTSYLRAQFVRLRGHPPLAHLHTVRLQQALLLLRNSDASLEVIARVCGYDSASHLSRYVKRATGKSPGSLRSEKPRRDEEE